MNDLSRQKDNNKRPLTSMQILNGIFHWLTDFFSLTEEEQRDAGIDLGYRSFLTSEEDTHRNTYTKGEIK